MASTVMHVVVDLVVARSVQVSVPSPPVRRSISAASLNQLLIWLGSVTARHTTSAGASIRISRSILGIMVCLLDLQATFGCVFTLAANLHKRNPRLHIRQTRRWPTCCSPCWPRQPPRSDSPSSRQFASAGWDGDVDDGVDRYWAVDVGEFLGSRRRSLVLDWRGEAFGIDGQQHDVIGVGVERGE